MLYITDGVNNEILRLINGDQAEDHYEPDRGDITELRNVTKTMNGAEKDVQHEIDVIHNDSIGELYLE